MLRLFYLSVTGVFGLLRLLPVSDRDKDAEIVVLRHQIAVLQRQLGTTRPRFSPGDRAFLAALLHRLPAACSAGSGCWCAPTQCCAH
jgi:putative transposase